MRIGRKCVRADTVGRSGIDASADEFAETMGYSSRRYASQAEFLRFHSGVTTVELNGVLRELLDRSRSILSIGSGEGEHELPFALEGYNILATDIVDSASQTTRLFPALRFQVLDAFTLPGGSRWEDLLVTGIDCYFDDERFDQLLGRFRETLSPGGRLIFVLRYRDNLATRIIDAGQPVLCWVACVLGKLRLTSKRWQMKQHGYRRSESEIIAAAKRHGFRLGRLRHAGFGVELTRWYVDRLLPPVFSLVRAVDRRLNVLNNAVVFEFLV